MGLFGSKKKEQAPKPPEQRNGRIVAIKYVPGYRGTQRTKLTTYGNKTATKDLAHLDKNGLLDLNGKTITVKEIFSDTFTDQERNSYIAFFVKSYQIGVMFNHDDVYNQIISGKIKEMHVEIRKDNPLEPDRINTYIFTPKQ